MGLQGAPRVFLSNSHKSIQTLLIPSLDQYFHANIPGFEAFLEGSNDNQFVRNVILKFLTTKNLGELPRVAQPICLLQSLEYTIVANARLLSLF